MNEHVTSRRRAALWVQYGIAVGLAGVATVCHAALSPFLGESAPMLFFLIAVVLCGWRCGFGPGLLAAVLGLVAGNCLLFYPLQGFPPQGFPLQRFTFDLPTGIRSLAFGLLSGIVLMIIRALRRAEDRARESADRAGESQARLRDFVENAATPIHWVGSDGVILWANQAELDLLGYSREEYVGRPLADFHADRPVIDEILACLGRGETLLDYEARLRCKDGSVRHVLISSNPLFADNKFIHTGCFTRDITERKQFEQAAAALRESEDRFALFMKHLPGAAWMKDTEGRYVYANETGERIFHRTLEELRGRTDEEVFAPETAAQFRANDRRALESGQGIQTIETLPQPDGVHHSIVNKFPIFGPGRKPILVGGVAIDISDRRRAEEQLREQSNLTRSITDTAPVALFRLDGEGRITFANPAAACMFGWEEPELIGRSLHDTLHHHYVDGRPYPSSECPIVAAGRGGRPLQDHEDVYFRKDGRPLNVLCSAAPLQMDGVSRGSVLAVQDITERKRTADLIRAQEAQFRRIADATPVMLTRCSRDRRYLFVNRAYAAMHGLAPEQIVGKPIREIIGGEAYTTILPHVESVLQGRPVEFEMEVPYHRVGPHYLRATYIPDEDGRGQVQGWVASISDLTERRQTEERSARLNETLLSVMEAIPDIVFVTETDGTIQFKNPAGDRFTSAVGLRDQLPAPIQVELDRVMQTGQHHLPTSFKTVHRFVIQHEERFFLSRIVGMTTPAERIFGAVVMLQDVTEFRLLDEVKTNLIATVSHELKTPMTSLRTALLLLLEQNIGTLNAKQAEMVGIARDESERLLRTLNELLDLTRFEDNTSGMRLDPALPAELIQAAVDGTALAAETARLSVKLEVLPDLPPVSVDRERIVHVLTNFLTNAIKYSPEGGEITVRAKKNDQDVVFSVIDRGPGVPRQYQSRIFEKFVRLPGTPKKGVGLGLWIAREFVRAHRGRIGVRSEAGQGSEFYFSLPVG